MHHFLSYQAHLVNGICTYDFDELFHVLWLRLYGIGVALSAEAEIR